jgi:hypothetical protein
MSFSASSALFEVSACSMSGPVTAVTQSKPRQAGLHVVDVRGSFFFPPSGLAARLVAPFEPLLTRHHAPGAAFLALAADKPEIPL